MPAKGTGVFCAPGGSWVEWLDWQRLKATLFPIDRLGAYVRKLNSSFFITTGSLTRNKQVVKAFFLDMRFFALNWSYFLLIRALSWNIRSLLNNLMCAPACIVLLHTQTRINVAFHTNPSISALFQETVDKR